MKVFRLAISGRANVERMTLVGNDENALKNSVCLQVGIDEVMN